MRKCAKLGDFLRHLSGIKNQLKNVAGKILNFDLESLTEISRSAKETRQVWKYGKPMFRQKNESRTRK